MTAHLVACRTCRRPLPVDADPRRVTCSNACRQRAYRRRLAEARAALGARVTK
ncbi:hypothetical protein [Demequina rhizosphaerae]|uniref:hypothetical protein n=1 Tax=Demequina rhizosphaerae TaxID=1638985 RepID=UPI000AF6F8CF|nr:hypothetical protein [Demequina rhizosphaerae]